MSFIECVRSVSGARGPGSFPCPDRAGIDGLQRIGGLIVFLLPDPALTDLVDRSEGHDVDQPTRASGRLSCARASLGVAGPAFKCMGERADFLVTNKPCDLGNRQGLILQIVLREVGSQRAENALALFSKALRSRSRSDEPITPQSS